MKDVATLTEFAKVINNASRFRQIRLDAYVQAYIAAGKTSGDAIGLARLTMDQLDRDEKYERQA